MGSKYPILTPHQTIKVLKKLGFDKISQKGSHVKYRKINDQTKRTVIIPMHNEIAKGTLKSILQQANIELDKFLDLL